MTGSLSFWGPGTKWVVTYQDPVSLHYYGQAVIYPPYGSNTWNYYYDQLLLSSSNIPVSFSLGGTDNPGAILESKE